MMTGSETAADCDGWLSATYYWDGIAVVTCPEDYFYPGGERYKGSSTPVGR
jgi:hypothetical protein